MEIIINDIKRSLPDEVVTSVNWSAVLKSGDNVATKHGTTLMDMSVDDPDFIPFKQLTELIVKTWLTDELDITAIEDELTRKITIQQQPTEINGLPWNEEITI